MNIKRIPIYYAPIIGSSNHPVEELTLEELQEEDFNTSLHVPPKNCRYIDFWNTRDPHNEKIYRRLMWSPGEYVNLVPCYMNISCDGHYSSRWGWFNLNSLLYTDNNGTPLYPEYYSIQNIQERVKMLLEDGYFVPKHIVEKNLAEEVKKKAEELKYSIDKLVFQPFTLSKSLARLNTLGKRIVFTGEANLRTIITGVSFLRLLYTYTRNPEEFDNLFHIEVRMPFADFLKLILGKSTIGIHYNREDYTFIVETNMGVDISSVVHDLSKTLYADIGILKNQLPSERFPSAFESIINEAYFKDYKEL